MAGVSLPPGQTVAGTSLVPLLKGSGEARTGSGGKGWALSVATPTVMLACAHLRGRPRRPVHARRQGLDGLHAARTGLEVHGLVRV